MAIKLKIPTGNPDGKPGKGWLPRDPLLQAALVVFLVLGTIGGGFFTYYYVKFGRMIDQRFKGPVFGNSARIYAISHPVQVGEKIEPKDIATQLRRAGYSDKDGKSPMGSYRLFEGGIEIKPGPDSYHSPESAIIRVQGGKVASITSKSGDLGAYELEPQMITSLFDAGQRSKRELVTYDEIPKLMVDAVLAIEDRRFFQHGGVNFLRLAEATWVDVTHGRHEQGGSTITMQLSRAFFLTPQKTVKRKLSEMLIALEMEQKLSKQQIFEFYANRVDLGQRGSFTISGFAQAARAYFNKDLKDLTPAEAALIAGIIQAPSYLSPYRHPERALERRNLVLDTMVETHTLSKADAEKAKATPLKLAPPNVEASDAPYFVDLLRETLISKLDERQMNDQGYRIYSTIDPDLQKAAAAAVETGMKLVDDQVTKLRTKRTKIGKNKYETKVLPGPQAQVAMVVMDPHTGEVLALVGGRNYGVSQLNHAVAKRPTGSIFKPFVYAAAMNTALDGSNPVFTPASTVQDAPGSFAYGDQIYEPRNYKEEYHGDVTARYALALSLNNATVKLAEEVGYEKVADLAKAAGIASVKATPAMALGAYDATPMDMAAAYTVFANAGVRISPTMVNSVRNANGDIVLDFKPEAHPVLDPRVAFLMTNMMEGVMNFGTAYGPVRARGFIGPQLEKQAARMMVGSPAIPAICYASSGSDSTITATCASAEHQSAAPIWAEFMKKALTLPTYSDMQAFSQPTGVIDVQLDKTTNLLATPACPEDYSAAFIAGTEPSETCDQSTGMRGFFSRVFGLGGDKALPPPPPGAQPAGPGTTAGATAEDPNKKKKGFFGKIAGIFKDDKPSNDPPAKPADTGGNGKSPQ